MNNKGISEAFYEAVCAVGKAIGVKPLPVGLNEADVNGWHLTLNTSSDRIDEHDPFTVKAVHQEYIGIAIFDPAGGMIGGIPEDRFIADMRAFNQAEAA